MLPRSFVPRAGLWERLDTASRGAVTLLVAPAGAGKTLGVAGWLETRGLSDSALWVSVDQDLTADVLERLLATGAATAPHLLLLDDAHRLPPDSATYLDRLLSEQPESLNLLLLARWDPPLTRLIPELLGNLTALRGGVLRLDREEIAMLVTAQVGAAPEEVVAAVDRLSQGWCAIAVLAARAIATDRDPSKAAARLLQARSVFADRVLDEVFASLSSPQRHLLLCVTGERRLTGELARHLSQDPTADETLEELESTGLLVTRHEVTPPPGRPESGQRESVFDIHPLLREVVQRRIRLGGVEVVRARASVRRAIRADVAQGEVGDAFGRLLAVDASHEVVGLLASHGVELAADRRLAGTREFVRRQATVVDRHPGCWLPIALERWYAGDLQAAKPWLHRLLDRSSAHRHDSAATSGETGRLTLACVRLLLAWMGDGNLAEAVVLAETDLASARDQGLGTDALARTVGFHTGMAQLRLGHLRGAERHFAGLVGQSRARGVSGLALSAGAQLAITQFLLGREHACLDVAESVARDLRTVPRRRGFADVRQTVDVARGLAVVQRILVSERAIATDEDLEERAVISDDPVVAGLARIVQVRGLLLRGAVARAEQLLTDDTHLEELPQPLIRLVAFERALLAVLSADWHRLGEIEVALSGCGAPAEATLVAGLRADGLDDTRAADSLYALAAEQATSTQPPTAAMARVCRAQLLDLRGRNDQALDLLAEAVTATQARRSALPFLGWSSHGTPVALLFQRLSDRLNTDWARQLATETAARPGGIVSAAAPLTATPRERAQVPAGVVRPSLSPRERDVLQQLARGATYADIAADLFVSENTVKTHVSSLYAKLSVSRRSDALAVARTLRLL
jgi:ATP/maltotriose-dependent transcriptional regulator MalT